MFPTRAGNLDKTLLEMLAVVVVNGVLTLRVDKIESFERKSPPTEVRKSREILWICIKLARFSWLLMVVRPEDSNEGSQPCYIFNKNPTCDPSWTIETQGAILSLFNRHPILYCASPPPTYSLRRGISVPAKFGHLVLRFLLALVA